MGQIDPPLLDRVIRFPYKHNQEQSLLCPYHWVFSEWAGPRTQRKTKEIIETFSDIKDAWTP